MRSAVLLVFVAACFAGHKLASTPVQPQSVLQPMAADEAARKALAEPVTNAQIRPDGATAKRTPASWQDIAVVARDGDMVAAGGGGAAPPPAAEPIAEPVALPAEQLVVEMWVALQVDDVAKSAAAIGEHVVAAGGRVVSSNVEGRTSGALVVRVPPAKAHELSTWLASVGALQSQRTLATDVSKELFDRDLALRNLHVTMDRLEALAKRELPLAELLEIEKEMTRVRGDIERIEGEQRFLVDRVQYATLNVTLSSEAAPLGEVPEAHVYPGARFAMLALLDHGTGPAAHVGGGVTVRASRLLTFDLDLFPREAGDSRAVLATVGAGLYSDYFGFGRRRLFNPFVGARIGYAYVSSQGGFVIGGELGLELVHDPRLTIEISTRALAFARDTDTTAAFEGIAGAAVPF